MLIPGLQVDHDSSVPVYRQIAEGVRKAVLAGHVEPGHRLPPTRDLARQIGVNRQTVVAAYDHLAAEGWVEGRTGKGTFLATPPEARPAGAGAAGDGRWLTSFSRAVEGPGVGGLLSMYQVANEAGGISFAGSYPARDLLPVRRFGEAMTRALADQHEDLLIYGPTAGLPALRERIAGLMRDEGATVDPEQILITNGAQQAIELVFHTFLERGDAVIIEEPTYTGALSVLGSIGARLIGVPVDGNGMRLDALAIALERHRPKLMYVQPSFHNPTTAVMDEARRRELLALAARNRCVVVEDDWASGLRLDGDDPPSLHAIDRGRHVIYIGTFSKKLLPGIRVGWIAAPGSVMDRLVTLKQIRDCGTSPLLQAALNEFLLDGGLDDHLQQVLPVYRKRRDAMLDSLTRHLPRGAVYSRPAGGLFVWVSLPRGFDVAELLAAARQRGVSFSRGDLFHGGADGRQTLRLTYSTASPEQIEAGVKILGNLIRQRWPDRSDAHARRAVESVPIL